MKTKTKIKAGWVSGPADIGPEKYIHYETVEVVTDPLI